MAKATNINGINFTKVDKDTFEGKFNAIEFCVTNKNSEFILDIFKLRESGETSEANDEEDYIESVEMDTIEECADYIREQYK